MRIRQLACVFLLAISSLADAAGTLQFAGETYQRVFISTGEQMEAAGYLRPGETREGWTKMVVVRHYGVADDPPSVSNVVLAGLQEQNPGMQYRVLTAEDNSLAQLDYLIWNPDSGVTGFSIRRFFRQQGISGILEYQFLHRSITPSAEVLAAGQPQRDQLVSEMLSASFELNFKE